MGLFRGTNGLMTDMVMASGDGVRFLSNGAKNIRFVTRCFQALLRKKIV